MAHRTPVLTSHTLDEATGCRVFFKCENFQRVGAFKFRGAYNAISRLSDAERAAGVITHSGGQNTCSGVSWAAKLLGVRAVVVIPRTPRPTNAPPLRGMGRKLCPAKRCTAKK